VVAAGGRLLTTMSNITQQQYIKHALDPANRDKALAAYEELYPHIADEWYGEVVNQNTGQEDMAVTMSDVEFIERCAVLDYGDGPDSWVFQIQTEGS
jgi:hypothetical protein